MPEPGRTLTAREVGRIVNRDKRSVIKWSQQGLPHDTDDTGRQPVLMFDIREVRDYCDDRGLEFVKGGGGGASRDRASPPDGADDDELGEFTDYERRQLAEQGVAILSNSRGSLEQMAGAASRMLETITTRRISPNATPQQLSSLATALRNASQELRLVIEAATEHDRQQRNTVDRVEAETLVFQVAKDIMRDLDSIAGDSPRRIVDACARAGVSIGDPDRFARVAGEAMRGIVSSVRAKRARMLEQRADELEAAGWCCSSSTPG